jgi:signal transduction histidine kinase
MSGNRVASWIRLRVGPLPRQLALTVAIAVTPVLVALVVIGLLMVLSGHDVLLVAAIVLAAGVLGVTVARLVAGSILGDVESIRDGLSAVGQGQRSVKIDTTGRDELAELARAANSMIAQLRDEEAARRQSDQARRDLVAAVSHDLRTPITSLRLLAEAVDDEVVQGELRRGYLERMRTHIDVLSALIDDLFELSRLEAGDIRWTLERVPLGELVGETVEAMRVQADRKGVAVLSDVSDCLRPARGNPEKLQRVLFNLIQNAIRHTPADGSVVVRAEPVDGRIEIEVADDGDGIAPEERDRVFTAFYRGGADAARTGAGAGLGLAVSRAIVEAHGGQIWLAEAPVGTRVRFSLPVAA